MSDPIAKLPTSLPRPKPPKHNNWPILGGVSACVVIVLFLIVRSLFFGSPEPAAPPEPSAPIAEKTQPDPTAAAAKTAPAESKANPADE